MEREVAIKISGVKKKYRLGQIGGGTLRGDLQSWWARVRGKEDPNTKIGTDQRSNGKTFMALNGVDLTVYKGETLGVIGHNGAGKSTLLKLLCRVTAPTEGIIGINGRIASMLEVGTGFNQEMTGRENIYMNGAILGMTKAEVDAKMEEIIEFSEVREFIDTPVKRYSSGMYVKLAFSVAAHLDSEIMIMDEVLAVGDMKFQQKCLGKMGDAAANEGRTVIYVSHNMNTIRNLCTRCIVLDKGKIIYDGNVEEAISVYLDQAMVEQKIFNDYTSMERMKHLQGMRTLDLVSCQLEGKKMPYYKAGEPLFFYLKWKLNASLKDIYFRLEYRRTDGTAAGAALCEMPIDAKLEEATFVADISMLVDGTYSTLIVAYEMNEFGTKRDIDAVKPAFVFTKETDEITEWDGESWGYVQFPDLKLYNNE